MFCSYSRFGRLRRILSLKIHRFFSFGQPVPIFHGLQKRPQTSNFLLKFQREPRPVHKSYIAMMSFGIFMLYFCVLREENEIDDVLDRDLYDILGGRAFLIEEAIANRHERVFGPAYKNSHKNPAQDEFPLSIDWPKCKRNTSIKLFDC